MVTFGPAVVRAGELLGIRIVTPGPGCLSIPALSHYGFAKLSETGVWESVPRACDGDSPPPIAPLECVDLPAFSPLEPGVVLDASRRVPPDFAPGRYRVGANLPGVSRLEFEVVG